MLTGKHRRWLRAQAHHLDPVVQVGHDGLSESVIRQVDEALAAHELIKVRVSSDAPEGADVVGVRLGEATRSEVAQVIGRVVVLFRRRPKRPKVKLTSNPDKSRRAPSKGHVPRPARPNRPKRSAPPRGASKKSRGRGRKKSVR